MSEFDRERFARGLRLLGIPPAALKEPLRAPSMAQALDQLEQVQRAAKNAHKRAAARLHPDQGGDPEQFMDATYAAEQIAAFRIVEQPAPRQRPVTHAWVRWTTNASTATSTTSTQPFWTW